MITAARTIGQIVWRNLPSFLTGASAGAAVTQTPASAPTVSTAAVAAPTPGGMTLEKAALIIGLLASGLTIWKIVK